ncbi:hypothetical protein C2L64_48765 [Paraburkholderia hospita]|uniref:Uncharacterized protein n=1 Tax=Paraburkholderia hospita TaxID=169430 RepID=A0AAN1JN46_9BURK|nr:hypothetical protein C2L64_48765 [Paraburkholderia hospita]
MIYNLLFDATGCFTDDRPGIAGCLTLPPTMLKVSGIVISYVWEIFSAIVGIACGSGCIA